MKGKLAELIEVIIEEKTSLFVCAVGVPPKSAVDRLHEARIPVRKFYNICSLLQFTLVR
jgi:NAD(P)H-dependent flavin oxidoreductase YrpB (nitropropane dioxygenase family)